MKFIDTRSPIARFPYLKAMPESVRNKRQFENSSSLNYGPEVNRQVRKAVKSLPRK